MERSSDGNRKYNYAPRTSMVAAMALFIAVLIGALPLSNVFADDGWRIFRSDEFKFRFLYPVAWEFGAPRGANVRVTLFPQKGAPSANCNILVKNAPDLTGMKQEDLNHMIQTESLSASDWVTMLGKWPDMKVIDSGNVKVDNQPVYFSVIEFSHESLDRKVFIKGTQWVTFTPGVYWQFGCYGKGATIEEARRNYEFWLPVFKKMMGSFVFERW